MEQTNKSQFLHEKIERLIYQTKDLITLFSVECILMKAIERASNNGQPTLSQEFLAKYLIGRSWKYAFTPKAKILINHEILDFCDRLQYFSRIPVNAPEKDVVDFLEYKNFSKIREFFPKTIIECLMVAEKALIVPEDEFEEKAIFKNNRTKDTKEITAGYVYNDYPEEVLRENINLIKSRIRELTSDNATSENQTESLGVNTEVLIMAKEIITNLVNECRDKSGFQKGVSLIDAEIIPLLNKDIEDLKIKEAEFLRLELVNLMKSFQSKIQNNSSFIVEISKDDIKCSIKEG